ncbi:hypothetical protein N9Z44_00720 [Mariniblastus sp.]|nr:hypothetical protein [Mariniblastus sp.]|eukprot:COSAG01_NODE_14541_length_1440_cov_1.698732_1_plen_414_part_00
MMFQNLKVVCGIGRLFIVPVVVVLCSQITAAQDFKLDEYLKRKDVNSNGKLEPSEMSNNTRSYLSKNGFNPEKPVSISKVLSKLSKEKASKEKADRKMNRERKVPGFGVEKEESGSGVSRFGATTSKAKGSTAKKVTYSDSVNRQVDSTLGRYDRNKDGSLDKEEMSRARWGSPTPQESDTNKDGRLSRSELSNRYASRESAYRNSSSSRGSSSRDSSKSSSKKSSSSAWRPTSTRSTSSSSKESSTSRKPSSSSSSSSSSSREKYEKYAASLIGQYDENKDGKLDGDEIKKMRRPPVGADQNKDGFVTKSELYDSLSGANKPASKSSSTADARKTTSSSSSRSSRWGSSSSRSSSRSSSGSSRDFEKFDKNEDRQVQMHEYSAKWDEKTVKEFYEKDKNSDGVITLKEWSSK